MSTWSTSRSRAFTMTLVLLAALAGVGPTAAQPREPGAGERRGTGGEPARRGGETSRETRRSGAKGKSGARGKKGGAAAPGRSPAARGAGGAASAAAGPDAAGNEEKRSGVADGLVDARLLVVGVFRATELSGRVVAAEREVYLQPAFEATEAALNSLVGRHLRVFRRAEMPTLVPWGGGAAAGEVPPTSAGEASSEHAVTGGQELRDGAEGATAETGAPTRGPRRKSRAVLAREARERKAAAEKAATRAAAPDSGVGDGQPTAGGAGEGTDGGVAAPDAPSPDAPGPDTAQPDAAQTGAVAKASDIVRIERVTAPRMAAPVVERPIGRLLVTAVLPGGGVVARVVEDGLGVGEPGAPPAGLELPVVLAGDLAVVERPPPAPPPPPPPPLTEAERARLDATRDRMEREERRRKKKKPKPYERPKMRWRL